MSLVEKTIAGKMKRAAKERGVLPPEENKQLAVYRPLWRVDVTRGENGASRDMQEHAAPTANHLGFALLCPRHRTSQTEFAPDANGRPRLKLSDQKPDRKSPLKDFLRQIFM